MGSIIYLLISILLFGCLLASAGLDWYIVYLLSRDETDFGRVRQYALGVGITLILLPVIIIALIVTSFFFGGEKAAASKNFIYTIIIIVLLICVGGINLAICPKAKALTEDPNADESDEKAKIRILAIAGAGFGTGIIALALFYYAFRGYLAAKRAKK